MFGRKKNNSLTTISEEVNKLVVETNKHLMKALDALKLLQNNVKVNQESILKIDTSINYLSEAIMLLNNRLLKVEQSIRASETAPVLPKTTPDDPTMN